MPDFFENPKKEGEEEKIKLGDKEYSQEELSSLVGLGEKAQDFSKDHGGFDKVVSEFGRRATELQKLNVLEKEKQELEKKLEEASRRKETDEELTPEQMQKAKEALATVLGGEPVTAKQLDEWYQTRRSGEKLLEETESLAGEITGEDGRPKFETEAVLKHMAETGIKNPMKAYKDLHEDALDEWKQAQLNKAKGAPFITGDGGARNKQPESVKVNKDNFSALLAETLYGANEE